MKGASVTLLSCLAASAVAAPASSSPQLSALQKRAVDYTKDCKKDLTRQMWEDGNYTSTLQEFLQQGPIGNDWSESGKVDKSALAVVKSRAEALDGFVCTPKDASNAHCTSQDIGSDENCKETTDPNNDPKAVTIMKAISNFANHMVSLGTEASKIADDIKGLEGELTEKFAIDKSTDGFLGNAGPYIIASSIAGVVPVFGGPIGGIFGVLIGANALTTKRSVSFLA